MSGSRDSTFLYLTEEDWCHLLGNIDFLACLGALAGTVVALAKENIESSPLPALGIAAGALAGFGLFRSRVNVFDDFIHATSDRANKFS